ncbi:MAG: MBL fold metallo-hydrolase [Variovorax sp.]|nr:MBL fold metallo-hydrolase [Variovorax sp.]
MAASLFNFLRTASDTPALHEGPALSRRRLLAAGCLCCALPFARAQSAGPLPAQALAHLEAARRAAGDSLRAYMRLGDGIAPTPSAPPVSPDALMALPAPAPGWAFDNLCFVGNRWVSAWGLTTPEGLVVIDAMDNDDEARNLVAAGLGKLGQDPATIRAVLITHGHGDHYGGFGHLRSISGARAAMSEADWTMTETKLEFDRPDWGRPPRRDLVLKEGEALRWGDTQIDVLLTPGHTMGTVSLLFDVREGKRRHRALLWGGTAFNFQRSPDRMQRLQAYIDQTERVRRLVEAQGVDVFISNHDLFDEAVNKLQARQQGGAGGNPFVMGTENVVRALTVMNECARATKVVWSA